MYDILGFRGLLDSLGLDGLTARVRKLEDDLRLHFQWEARFVMFSDTVLLYSPPLPAAGSPTQEFARQTFIDAFLRWCTVLQALSLIAELPMRGGVALGECVLAPSRGRLLGQPIVDAYLLSERQDWIGVAIHESCVPHLLRYEPEHAGVTVRAEIPLKANVTAEEGLTLDWPRRLPQHLGLREALSKQVEGNRNSPHAERWLRTWDYFECRTRIPPGLPPEGAQVFLGPGDAG
jgi:hypothetical protein